MIAIRWFSGRNVVGHAIASQRASDRSILDDAIEHCINLALELIVASVHGDRDVPVILGDIVWRELEAPFGSGVKSPAGVSPEVSVVDITIVQGFERRQLIAIETTEITALAEAVVGHRAGFRAQTFRILALEFLK